MGILVVGAALAFIGFVLMMVPGAASMLARLVLTMFRLPESEADSPSRLDAIDRKPDALSRRFDGKARRRR